MFSDQYAVWDAFYIIHTASHTEYHLYWIPQSLITYSMTNIANHTVNYVPSQESSKCVMSSVQYAGWDALHIIHMPTPYVLPWSIATNDIFSSQLARYMRMW